MKTGWMVLGVGMVVAALASGCNETQTPAYSSSAGYATSAPPASRIDYVPLGEPNTVVILLTPELTFAPSQQYVRAGTRVSWYNNSGLIQTVTADSSKAAVGIHGAVPQGARPFDSGTLMPGATYERVFVVSGEYRYFSAPYEAAGMVGVLTVLPPEGAPTGPGALEGVTYEGGMYTEPGATPTR